MRRFHGSNIANRIVETERLYMREMEQTDFDSLCNILQDEDTMYAYEGAFSDDEVREWLDRQISRYHQWNFGLWAVILKDTDEMIGQCGLTMQKCWKSAIFLIALIGIRVTRQKLQRHVNITRLKY